MFYLGDGVNFNVCTPYQPQSSESFCLLDGSQSTPLFLCANDRLRTSGSTETCTSDGTQSALPTTTLHDTAAGSRRPVVDTVSSSGFSTFTLNFSSFYAL